MVSKLTLLSQIQIMLVYDHIKSPRIVRRASLNIKGQFKEPITVFSVLFVLSDYQIVQKRSKYMFIRLWTNIEANDDETDLQRNFQKGV